MESRGAVVEVGTNVGFGGSLRESPLECVLGTMGLIKYCMAENMCCGGGVLVGVG